MNNIDGMASNTNRAMLTREAFDEFRTRIRTDRAGVVRELVEQSGREISPQVMDKAVDALMNTTYEAVQAGIDRAVADAAKASGSSSRLTLEGEANALRAGLQADLRMLGVTAVCLALAPFTAGGSLGLLAVGGAACALTY